MKNITVLFEDDDFLVLNKPAGLPVQGGAGVGASLDSLLTEAYKNRPFLVHRLDKDTSGVIVTAKTRESAAACSALFAAPAGLHKRYLALCAGMLEEKGIISETLLVKGRELTAETSYRRLACANFPAAAGLPGDAGSPANHPFSGAVSFLELQPATGRMHQIRRHLAQANCPVLGDDKYGNFALNKRMHKSLGLKRLLLHAVSIRLPPSLVKGGIEINAPLPDYFSAVLEAVFRRGKTAALLLSADG
ncbi:MAG: RluA family pseudouridine synthase [Spirochaetaceae bacterium]|jgi:23S rRNA pseudouridine955/2504/2580 synthase|nr:RluA family pseudouridine synthase [Spirochaetaceae bacterium]